MVPSIGCDDNVGIMRTFGSVTNHHCTRTVNSINLHIYIYIYIHIYIHTGTNAIFLLRANTFSKDTLKVRTRSADNPAYRNIKHRMTIKPVIWATFLFQLFVVTEKLLIHQPSCQRLIICVHHERTHSSRSLHIDQHMYYGSRPSAATMRTGQRVFFKCGLLKTTNTDFEDHTTSSKMAHEISRRYES